MVAMSTTARPFSSEEVQQLQARYDAFKARGLALDMTRGKPSSAQLDLAGGIVDGMPASDHKAADGTDTRNYGGADGLPEMKAIFAEMLETTPASVIVGGNSSLQMMHDTVVRALLHGVPDGAAPWGKGRTKFLCPSPGYDRHFAVCEHHGIEMVVVDMDEHGPDVEQVQKLVASDASIKGMWCVPKYSNPTGITYSDDVVRALASMKTAAPDFRLFWDNAYVVHDLYDTSDSLLNILRVAAEAGHPNRPLVFASTSKISLAGAGVAAMAASSANIGDAKRHIGIQTIGPDKVNQLRHVRFFRDLAGIHAHMKKHAALLRPKFEAIDRVFTRELAGKGIASWTKPRGGYFVSLDTPDGCAAEVVRLADAAGVKLTGAGATYPLQKDPRDRNLRMAPSLPPADQVELAMEIVAVCVQLAAARTQAVQA
jgi:DNA-binding transcriptional MocR family regulator